MYTILTLDQRKNENDKYGSSDYMKYFHVSFKKVHKEDN